MKVSSSKTCHWNRSLSDVLAEPNPNLGSDYTYLLTVAQMFHNTCPRLMIAKHLSEMLM